MIKKTTHCLIIASTSLALFACGSEGTFAPSNVEKNGQLNLSITDAAVDDASEVNIAIDGVSIKPKNGDAINYDFTSTQTINLLTLQNGLSESLLKEKTLSAGEYSWIKLNLSTKDNGETYSTMVDNDGTHTLYIPSGSESGLTVNSGFIVPESSAISLTIDFDLRKSIVVNNSDSKDKYQLKPSLRLVDNSKVGSFSGTISTISTAENCGSSNAVYIYEGSDVSVNDLGASHNTPVSSVRVNLDKGTYSYKAAFLNAGNYTLAVTCQADNDNPEIDDAIAFISTKNATIITGKDVTLAF